LTGYIKGMEKMFTREGTEYGKAVNRDETGKAFFSRLKTCGRCGGAGGSSAWNHTGWTCFDCGGKGDLGYVAERLYTAEELVKLNATRDKRRAKAEAKRAAKQMAFKAEADAKLTAFMAANGELVASAKACAGKSMFIDDLVAKLAIYGSWSEKQIAAVAKSVVEIAASEAKRAASGFVGKVGERIEVAVEVERVAGYDRPAFRGFGTEYVRIVTMRDAAGNAIVVKSPAFYGREKGDKFTLRATVKDHSEYRGEKQTIVMRAAVIGEVVNENFKEEEKAE